MSILPWAVGFATRRTFFFKEYTSVWNTLTTAASVREASDVVLMKYERPADQSESVQVRRAG